MQQNSELITDLIAAKNRILYLTDIFEKINILCLQLQGKSITIIESKKHIVNFLIKIDCWHDCIIKRDFELFPNLSTVHITEDEIQCFSQHLKSLKQEFTDRFDDILSLYVPEWAVNLFIFDINKETNCVFKDLLIDLSTEEKYKLFFYDQNLLMFWSKILSDYHFKPLANHIEQLLVIFPTTYLVECGFSVVSYLIDRRPNLNIEGSGDLRLYLQEDNNEFFEFINKKFL